MRIDNVAFRGKRTTIRMPDELWDLYLLAGGSRSEILNFVAEAGQEQTLLTASETARSFVFGFVKHSLVQAVK